MYFIFENNKFMLILINILSLFQSEVKKKQSKCSLRSLTLTVVVDTTHYTRTFITIQVGLTTIQLDVMSTASKSQKLIVL